jgi:alpha-2-macroglobulin
VDRQGAEPFRLAYMVRAVSPGRFHRPAASVEDMYRPAYRARTDAGTVTVRE